MLNSDSALNFMPEYQFLGYQDLSHSSYGHLTLKALGFFISVQHWGGDVFHPLSKIRYRHPRKLKFTGLIAYIMFYKIRKFEGLTVITNVIMTS